MSLFNYFLNAFVCVDIASFLFSFHCCSVTVVPPFSLLPAPASFHPYLKCHNLPSSAVPSEPRLLLAFFFILSAVAIKSSYKLLYPDQESCLGFGLFPWGIFPKMESLCQTVWAVLCFGHIVPCCSPGGKNPFTMPPTEHRHAMSPQSARLGFMCSTYVGYI